MRKAFIVVGPESSGTRATTKVLGLGGCFGDAEHDQRIDSFLVKNQLPPNVGDSPIVLRRSVPHEGVFPDLHKLDKSLSYNTNLG